jgi:membrane protease YdiL (CAAX protease family)
VEAFTRGVGIGVSMAVAVLLLLVFSGNASVSRSGDPFMSYAVAATPALGLLAVAALAEELLFRGLPLARLAAATGPLWASVILTAGFIGLHTSNPGVTTLGLLNIGLASMLLSTTFFFWGGVPAAWGLHLGWNAGLALGADAPVSGLGFRLPVFEFQPSGPEWVSGGAFGPEGGVMATLVMILAVSVLSRRAVTSGHERR